jgi:murein DD-endopeptidase MepM/ murein hydrolase activator NlpD
VGDITITGDGGAGLSAGPPLDDYIVWQKFGHANAGFDGRYHCADDLFGRAGTPVYAIADGVISYSGPMAGYGWLITIDHPQLDVYSLYGHLSTRRSKIAEGSVRKGDVIAYLADDDEDGSGGAYPDWEPHLHFAVRAGGIADYPAGAEDDRWMAGYTYAYPTALGWMDPTGFLKAHFQ